MSRNWRRACGNEFAQHLVGACSATGRAAAARRGHDDTGRRETARRARAAPTAPPPKRPSEGDPRAAESASRAAQVADPMPPQRQRSRRRPRSSCSKPATTTRTKAQAAQGFRAAASSRQQIDRQHDAGGGRDVLRNPGALVQPAAEAGGPADDPGSMSGIRSSSGRSDPMTLKRSTSSAAICASAEPGREPDHQHERCEGAEPGQRGIGFPAAGAEQHGKLGRAEMPEGSSRPAATVVRLRRRTDCPAAAPSRDHLVDHGDLGVIEDRAGEDDGAVGGFRQDRGGRSERDECGAEPRPERNAGRRRRRAAGEAAPAARARYAARRRATAA